MDALNVDTFNLLIFTIPGFFLVWSYRKQTKVVEMSDFEYLMFSITWGMVMLALLAYFSEEQMVKSIENIYVGTLVFSCFGIIFGGVAGFLSRKLSR